MQFLSKCTFRNTNKFKSMHTLYMIEREPKDNKWTIGLEGLGLQEGVGGLERVGGVWRVCGLEEVGGLEGGIILEWVGWL